MIFGRALVGITSIAVATILCSAVADASRVSLVAIDRTGRADAIPFAVYEAGGPDFGAARLTVADMKRPRSFLASLRAPRDPVFRALAALLSPSALTSSDDDALRATVDALNAAFQRDQTSAFASGTPSAEAKQALDARSKLSTTADNRTFYMRLNRLLLEDALPRDIVRTRAIASEAAGARVNLGRGDYWFIASAAPQLRVRAHVDSSDRSVRLRADDGLFATFQFSKRRPFTTLLVFKDARARRAVAARISPVNFGFNDGLAMLRPSPDDVAGALSLARTNVAALTAPPDVSGLTNEQAATKTGVFWTAYYAARRILTVAGDDSDAQKLVAVCTCENLGAKTDVAESVAYMESRLGTLENGVLRKLADGSDLQWAVAAAGALHRFGLHGFDGTIESFIADPRSGREVAYPSWELLDNDDGATLRAMRTAFASGRPNVAAVLYLAAYGDARDWQNLALARLAESDAAYLAPLLAAPSDSAAILGTAGLAGGFHVLTNAVNTLPSARRAAEFAAISSAVYNGSLAAFHDQSRADASHADFTQWATFERPTRTVASQFYGNDMAFVGGPPWVPAIFELTDLSGVAQQLVGGHYYGPPEWQFDYLTQAALRDIISSTKSEDFAPYADLYLAAHRVATRAYFWPGDAEFRDGVERRPYALRNLDQSGAIDGVLSMRPSISAGTLRFALHFEQRDYGNCGSFAGIGCGSDAENAPENHRYLTEDGRPLVAAVRLRRDGKTIDSRFVTDDAGWLIYEASSAGADLSGAYLDVALQYFDQHPTLTFDLFASEYARELRVLRERARIADDLSAQRRTDPYPWMVAAAMYAGMGQYDEADRHYRKAATLTDASSPWDADVALFSQSGDHARALAILTDELKAKPREPAVLRSIAGELFFTRKYAEAVSAAAQVLLVDPDDRNTTLLQAMALYLDGDRRGTAALIENDPNRTSARTAPLWYMAARSSGSDRVDDAKAAFDAARTSSDAHENALLSVLAEEGDVESTAAGFVAPSDVARVQTYVGYHYLWSGDRDKALQHFDTALATGQENLLEYRIAEFESAELRRRSPILAAVLWLLIIGALVAGGVFAWRRFRVTSA